MRLEEMMDIHKRAPLGCEAKVGRRRCKADVIASFGICSTPNGYMLVCADHDVELNRAALFVLGVPHVGQRIASYKRHRLPRIAARWREAWISSVGKRKKEELA